MKVLYISGSRADYGLMRSTLRSLEKEGFEVEIAVTGMHLMDEFGKTSSEVEKDGFPVHTISSIYKSDDRESMAFFLGNFITELTGRMKEILPDFIFVMGDRAEMLGGAIVGAYLYIPVVHIHGGDVSSTVDELVRHAITKLSHIHFAATKNSAERIVKMGEDAWRVHVVGAPGIDEIYEMKNLEKSELFQKLGLSPNKKTVLIMQYSVSSEVSESGRQIVETLEAVKEFCHENNGQCIVIYPNADSGGRKIIQVIDDYGKYDFVKIFKNLSRCDFLNLMKYADVMIGNSSSGIIEAPCFRLPVVNVGTRQRSRERSENVIDVGYEKRQIKNAIITAVDDTKFRSQLGALRNIYGNGGVGTRIAEILKTTDVSERLLQKRIAY